MNPEKHLHTPFDMQTPSKHVPQEAGPSIHNIHSALTSRERHVDGEIDVSHSVDLDVIISCLLDSKIVLTGSRCGNLIVSNTPRMNHTEDVQYFGCAQETNRISLILPNSVTAID